MVTIWDNNQHSFRHDNTIYYGDEIMGRWEEWKEGG